MKISFLIVNYFTAEYVISLVKSIKKYITNYNYEILILDNSCDSKQWEMIFNISNTHIHSFNLEENLGFTKGNNFLYSKSHGKIITIINPDSLLINNSLEHLFDFLMKSNNIGAVGPKLLNEDKSYQISYYKFPTLFKLVLEHIFVFQNPYKYKSSATHNFECDVIKGACLVLMRDKIEKVGLFDERFFMYSEEVDLCFRLIKDGNKNIYFPDTQLIHAGKKSSSQKKYTEFSLYHYNRSKIIYTSKYEKPLYTSLVKIILIVSLLEKAIILFLLNKRFSSKIHWNVLKKIIESNENLSNI